MKSVSISNQEKKTMRIHRQNTPKNHYKVDLQQSIINQTMSRQLLFEKYSLMLLLTIK